MTNRILNERIDIDEGAVTAFFEDRVTRYDAAHPLVSVIYQDSNPELAKARDEHEKRVVLPLLVLSPALSVLDIGCGIGRWADALVGKVGRYHGTDLIQGLIDIAAKRFSNSPTFSFQALKAQDNYPERLTVAPPFDLIIVTGLFTYLNDADCDNVLSNILRCCAPKARIFLREPVGLEQRLTLKDIWSEELQHSYSAIYRTADEYLSMISAGLGTQGFSVVRSAPLFPSELSNHKETTQHYFILDRGAS